MEVNGKNIKGIFLYSKDIKYTEGDFVVEGENMYVCLESSIGYPPSSTPNKFKPYLGATTSDEIEDSSTNYVSSYALGKYLSGTCNTKGLLTNELTVRGELFFRDFFGNELGVSLGDKYLDALDNLIVSSINQTIINVSKSIVQSVIGVSTNNPILRQYTYKTSSILWTRVQELINVDSGDMYFRVSTKTSENGTWSSPSSWKCVSVNSNYKNTINQIKACYTQKCNDLDIIRTTLLGSFRFKKIEITAGETVSIPTSSLSDSTITVCTRYDKGGGLYVTNSITIDLSSSITKYMIEDGKTLTITKSSSAFVLKTSGCVISTIYARNSFSYSPDSSYEIPIVLENNKTARIDLPSTNKSSYIKVSLPSSSSFVFPLTTTSETINITGFGTIQVTKSGNSFRIQVTEGTSTLTNNIKAAYVNIS